MNKKINKVVIAVVLAIDLILAVVLGLAVSWMMAIPFEYAGWQRLSHCLARRLKHGFTSQYLL